MATIDKANKKGMIKQRILFILGILVGQSLFAAIKPEAYNDQFFNIRVRVKYNLLVNQSSANDVDPGGLTISLLASETDTKTKNGSSVNVVSSSEVEFIPNDNYAGWDTFKYVIINSQYSVDPTLKDTAWVFVYMPSRIKTDSVILTNEDSIVIPILANDAITANSSVSFSKPTAARYGDVKFENNVLTYYPTIDFIGQEEYSYTVCDTYDVTQPTICKSGKIVVDRQQISIVVPAGLSPNGDMINDELKIPNIENFPKASLRIYNRLGEEVWSSLSGYNNDFNGKNKKGEDLPVGTYYYVLELNKTGYLTKLASSLTIQR